MSRSPTYECQSCGDTVTPDRDAKPRTVNGVNSAEHCAECFREKAFGEFPDLEQNRGPSGIDTDYQNRQYHGGRFHSGEW